VKLFVDHGADINTKNAAGETPLISAVVSQNKKIVKSLLHNRADVNTKDAAEESPLMLAVASQNEEIMESLLDHGASYIGSRFIEQEDYGVTSGWG